MRLPPRSDAGREILSILSARREEQARSWGLGVSPPARATNPLINDCSFHRQGEACGMSQAWNF